MVDSARRTAFFHDRPLDLRPREFDLLALLVAHPEQIWSREALLRRVWGSDEHIDARTVDVHVRRLRAKLGPEHEQLIGTVRNVGYRFDPQGARHHLDDDVVAEDVTHPRH